MEINDLFTPEDLQRFRAEYDLPNLDEKQLRERVIQKILSEAEANPTFTGARA